MKKVKPLIALVFMSVFLQISYTAMYFGGFELVNTVNVKAYNLYSTNGKYDYDPFLSEELDNETSIYSTIFGITNSSETQVSSKRELYKYLNDHSLEVVKTVSSNVEYMRYLESESLTTDDMLHYISQMNRLDENIMKGSFYISLLLSFLIIRIVFKYRKTIFTIASVVYFLLTLDILTNYISFYALYPFYEALLKLTLEEYVLLSETFTPAVNQAALTYIIFDVVIEYFSGKRHKKYEYRIKKIYLQLQKSIELCELVEKRTNVDICVSKVNIMWKKDLKYITSKSTSRNQFSIESSYKKLSDQSHIKELSYSEIKSSFKDMVDVISKLECIQDLALWYEYQN